MNPIGPRERHLLEQLQALTLEVSVAKKQLRDDLLAAGFTPGEAWEQAGRFEELALGRALDGAVQILPVLQLLDEFKKGLLGS